jgi:catechol 2,3-dioxygenase-like lactoylglutathione lyase family enzyme
MKRMHLHVSVPDLAQSIQFYSTLFGAPPSVVKDDYAKWMLDDPKVNLAISQRGREAGVDHVGIQVESPAELAELADRLKSAGEVTLDQAATTCCYTLSDKSWVTDPAGVRWETFYTFGEATRYGEDADAPAPQAAAGACCGPAEVKPVEVAATATACCGPAAA